jgi:transcriptional regulator with XRE-family HTH domain
VYRNVQGHLIGSPSIDDFVDDDPLSAPQFYRPTRGGATDNSDDHTDDRPDGGLSAVEPDRAPDRLRVVDATARQQVDTEKLTMSVDRPGPAPFGDELRRRRVAAGLTQEELAERSGVSVDAISALENGRRRRPHRQTAAMLAEALDLPPGERRALRAADGRMHADVPVPAPPAVVPRELPSPPADFTGRAEEVLRLRELVTPTAPTIGAIDGMGGTGKSALAIHAAHQLVDAFPDGQLYVDLRGATAGKPPLDPPDVLGRMLRSLGLSPREIPTEVEEAGARFRSVAAGRRLLLLLDNAHDVEQVRPLLPGSPTCGVLLTSRRVLATLEGAQVLHLDVLPEDQALELLGRLAGSDHIAVEPEAAGDVVRWCGRLPLAIRIVAARLAARRSWPVARLAERLRDERRRLDELAAGDLAVRSCIGTSYRALSEPSRRALRLLASLGVPDFGPWVAAALLELPPAGAEALVDDLVDAGLLEALSSGPGGSLRYRFHDLIRVYGRERGEEEDPREERLAAFERAAYAWVSLARRAGPGSGARQWLGAEETAMACLARTATQLGLDHLAAEIADSL